MKRAPNSPRPLRETEMKVEAEGRERTRRRQQRLQEEAERHGEISPLSGWQLIR